ncbi:MAG: hypothetical protein U1F53_08290 [Burkholderiaceae bacterium]
MWRIPRATGRLGRLRSLTLESSFTLDAALLADHKAANARRLYTRQIPVVRAVGFVIVCLMLGLQHLRQPSALPPLALGLLVAGNLLYAGIAWVVLRHGHGRSGDADLSHWLFHVDVLVRLASLSYRSRPTRSSPSSCSCAWPTRWASASGGRCISTT